MLGYNPEADLDSNVANMTAELGNVISGSVTQAIRDTTIDGLEIHDGDWMGIIDGAIKITDADRQQATINMINAMLDDDSEIVTVIIGDSGTQDEADASVMR